mmetsp:Transcript_43196/g.92177  ORF Transcript_43196/g.92177 Transcript_43196/m.92177 type:complete len:211 (+) Transcript_43196:77-709(+)
MYLTTVLQAIASEKKTLTAEDLYKLNEAIFNLPEEDHIDNKTSAKLFAAVQRITKAYRGGRHDAGDPNFFYDYVALLATMQNQHFFNKKQNQTLLEWLVDAVGGEGDGPEEPPAKPVKASPSNNDTKEVARLENENAVLLAQVEKLRALSDAVQVIQKLKLPSEKGEKQAKSAESKAKAKAKKAKSKGKAKVSEEADEAQTEEVKTEEAA